MKRLIFLLLALLFISCEKEGTYVSSKNAKADFNIEFLFECDGVKIYRFHDNGRARYFATGNGRMINSEHTESAGKSRIIVDDTVIQ